MNRFLILILSLSVSLTACADDRAIPFEKLPSASQSFITTNFPGVLTSFITQDDDFFPDYKVFLQNGVKIEFNHDGRLTKIKSHNADLIAPFVPASIQTYVATYYPASRVIEYEQNKRSHEVTLNNGLELEFDNAFILIEIDD